MKKKKQILEAATTDEMLDAYVKVSMNLLKEDLKGKLQDIIKSMREEMASQRKQIEDYIDKQNQHSKEQEFSRESANTRMDQHIVVVERYLDQQSKLMEKICLP